ncbi:tetratricopeptide repeat protein [Parapedobacter sp. 2B3]|uniref:tetratricopeptide repeat protein n=1 Tax=Parapedobacter sp. 2B3 TaxID=3342381 RepID=UPI0035B5BA4F
MTHQVRRLSFLLLILLFGYGPAYTQQASKQELDSLKAAVRDERDPSKKGTALLNLANRLPRAAFDDAMHHIDEASDLFRKEADYKGLVRAHLLLGDIHFKRQQFPQALRYDSLGISLADSVGDLEGKVKLLSNQARDFSISGNHLRAEQSAREALAIESTFPHPDIRRLTSLYNLLGIICRTLDSLQQSLAYFDKGLAYRDSLIPTHAEDRMLVNLYMNKASTLTKLQRFEEAVDMNLAAIRIREELGDSIGLQQSFNNVAVVLRSAAEDDKALEYFRKSLAISRAAHIPVATANTLVNMATIYFSKDQRDTAYQLYEEAIQLADSISNERLLRLAHHNYGNSLRNAGELDLARQHLERALDYAEAGGGTGDLNITRTVLGRVYFESGDLARAEHLYAETLRQTDTTAHTDNLMTLYGYLRDLGEKKGDYRSAFHYQTLFGQLFQQRLTENERVAILKAENQYQLDKKDLLLEAQRKEALQKRRTLLIVAIAIILLLAALSAIILLRRRQLNERHRSEVRQLATKHRLDTAQALRNAEEKERKKIADRLHDEVGALLSIARLNVDQLETDTGATPTSREKLRTTQKLLGDVADTVRNISHILMPVALEKQGLKAAVLELVDAVNTAGTLRIEDAIDGFNNTGTWEANFCHTVYRIVQEIINNTVKHAGASHLLIQLVELESSITIYMEDNGRGINTLRNNDGLGMSLLRNNIAYYNGAIEVNGRENEGTFILIELPIRRIQPTVEGSPSDR